MFENAGAACILEEPTLSLLTCIGEHYSADPLHVNRYFIRLLKEESTLPALFIDFQEATKAECKGFAFDTKSSNLVDHQSIGFSGILSGSWKSLNVCMISTGMTREAA